MENLIDFTCSHCYAMLPGIPAHGDNGTYCTSYCRQDAEPDFGKDEDEDEA